MENHTLTIVIPAKNERGYVGKLFDSILCQDYPAITSTPIYVADACSTDGMLEVISEYQSRLNISVIRGGLPSVGRNRGAALAKSEFILFLDADVELPDPTIIRRAIETAVVRNLDLVTIYIKCPEGSFVEQLLYNLTNLGKWLSQFEKPFANGPFILFRRERFNELGGFDETISFSEDTVLSSNIDQKKFAIIPGAVVTSNRIFKRGHWRIFWLGIVATFKRKNPDYFRNKDFRYFE